MLASTKWVLVDVPDSQRKGTGIDRHPDEELAPIFEQAAKLMQSAGTDKKSNIRSRGKINPWQVGEIVDKLRALPSREIGDASQPSCFPRAPAKAPEGWRTP